MSHRFVHVSFIKLVELVEAVMKNDHPDALAPTVGEIREAILLQHIFNAHSETPLEDICETILASRKP